MRKVRDAKRTLHLKQASVNTELEEMEQQEKGEKEKRSGYEKNRWAVVLTAELFPVKLPTRLGEHKWAKEGIQKGMGSLTIEKQSEV